MLIRLERIQQVPLAQASAGAGRHNIEKIILQIYVFGMTDKEKLWLLAAKIQ